MISLLKLGKGIWMGIAGDLGIYDKANVRGDVMRCYWIRSAGEIPFDLIQASSFCALLDLHAERRLPYFEKCIIEMRHSCV
jgi:hypothetical protein